jgi:hypothetical protein
VRGHWCGKERKWIVEGVATRRQPWLLIRVEIVEVRGLVVENVERLGGSSTMQFVSGQRW